MPQGNAAGGVPGNRPCWCLPWWDMEESNGGRTRAPSPGAQSTGMAVGLGGQSRWSSTARSVFQDPGASFDVNDQDPDPQPRYTQMNDNR